MTAAGNTGSRSFQLGKNLTVTVPDAVAEQVTNAFADTFGRGARGRKAGADARTTPERLSVDRIVEVAMEQMRDRGYDAVTMRSIAKELGTGPASLYAHVANRAELDGYVVDRVCAQWQLPEPDPKRWDEQVREALRALGSLLRAHPGVARCTMGMIPTTATTLVSTERMLGLLRAGGVPEQDAAWFVDVATLYVGATVVEEEIWRGRSQDPAVSAEEMTEDLVVAKVREVFSSLPEEHFPMVRAMATVLTTGSGEERFDFGVDLLVGGLTERAKRHRN